MQFAFDDVHFELKEQFDFSFLSDYGRVFSVFDKNDSGNISFGVQSRKGKYFIKVAGAKTLNAGTIPEKAIETLQKAMPVYEELRHSTLINLLEHRRIPGGYIAVFDWAEGECMHAHWDFDKYPKHTHPKAPFYRYTRLPFEEILRSLTQIFEFHAFAANKNYVAIDFYDGSVMYDFSAKKTTICDIDFYRKAPCVNDMGRMWGSSRFMSPEEFELGAALDEVTNVFCMGAAAFNFLGDANDKSIDKWCAGEKLYNTALKAVSNSREERYQSLEDFLAAWINAIADYCDYSK